MKTRRRGMSEEFARGQAERLSEENAVAYAVVPMILGNGGFSVVTYLTAHINGFKVVAIYQDGVEWTPDGRFEAEVN